MYEVFTKQTGTTSVAATRVQGCEKGIVKSTKNKKRRTLVSLMVTGTRFHNRIDPSLQEYLECLSEHLAVQFGGSQLPESPNPDVTLTASGNSLRASSSSSWSPSPTWWSSSSWTQSWQKWHSDRWQDDKRSEQW